MFPAFFSWERGVKNIVWMGNGIRKGRRTGKNDRGAHKRKGFAQTSDEGGAKCSVF